MTDRKQAVPGCTNPEVGADLEKYLAHELAARTEEAFEDHYFRCAACLEEMRVRQALPAALGGNSQVGRKTRWFVALSAAAAVFFLATTSYLWIYKLPRVNATVKDLTIRLNRVKETLEAVEEGRRGEFEGVRMTQRWTGNVAFLALTGPSRDGRTDDAILTIQSGQPFVPLATTPTLPSVATPDARLTFRIRPVGRDIVWKLDMTAREIRRSLETDRMVTFLIPASALSPGEHVIEMVSEVTDTGESLWSARFRVKASEPGTEKRSSGP